MANVEIEFLDCIKRDIEQKLFSEHRILKTRDLKYIAEVIEDKSKVTLSLSTLKRLWKDNFSQTPQPSTLDALASILEFDSWQEYKNQKTIIPKLSASKKPKAWVLYVGIFLLCFIGATLYLIQIWNADSSRSLNIKGPIIFSANKTVSKGVPNTVMFNYDVSNVEADSFFIQQSWNDRDRIRIDPEHHILSSVYYTPSFHRAKLIANDSIIATYNVHIQSADWMPYVKYNMSERIPVYFPSELDLTTDGSLQVTKSHLESADVNLKEDFFLRYVNIRNFEKIDQDNFSLQTRFKNEKFTDIVCPFSEILLVFEKDIYWIQFVKKGCEGDCSLKIGENYLNGRQNDLSMFGTDIYNWQEFEMNTSDKFVSLKLNEQSIFDLRYKNQFGDLVGIIYTFKGGGSVDFLKLVDRDKKVVYEDYFDQ